MNSFKNFVIQIITFYIFNNRLIILIKSFKSKKTLPKCVTLEENSKGRQRFWGFFLYAKKRFGIPNLF
ncbi:hypothetical protein CVV77_11250 [Bacillus sp. SN1]|nr:hypothetical protein CVV77_11250 [Bacillus sp. SN1]